MSGWIRFKPMLGGAQGIIIELDETLKIINYKTFYSNEDQCIINKLVIKGTKLYFYGERLENYLDRPDLVVAAQFLGVLNLVDDSLLTLTPSFEQWSTQRYRFIYSVESLLDDPGSKILYTLSRSISLITPSVAASGIVGTPLLTAYDTSGLELWDMKYDLGKPSQDTVYDYFPTVFNYTADSNIFILGLRLTAPRDFRMDFFTLVVDRENGELLHSQAYEDPKELTNKQYFAESVPLSNGDILTGGYLSFSSPTGFLQKYNRKGCRRGNCIEQDTTGIRQFSRPEETASHYPNPAVQNITFSGITNCSDCQIQFFDISGKLKAEMPYQKTVPVAGMTKGIHLLRVVNPKGRPVYTGKSIIQ